MSDSTSDLSEIVKKVIERDASIRNDLTRNLINVRALARYIKSSTGVEASIEAIISAIRRYPVTTSVSNYYEIGKSIVKLTLKNKIVAVSIINEPSIATVLSKFVGDINFSSGETIHLITGLETIKVIIDDKNLEKLYAVVPKKNIRRVAENLSAIIIRISHGINTVGVFSTLSNEVAMKGIKIYEFISCVPEIIVIVKEEDSLSSYASLQQLSQNIQID